MICKLNNLLNLSDSLFFIVHKKLENNNDPKSIVAKRKKNHQQCSDSIRVYKFIEKVQNIIDESN